MYINEDHFPAEVIDPASGDVLPHGVEGELVFTSLTKRALPLIRYRTGDIALADRGAVRGGRTLVRMSEVRVRPTTC